MSAIVNVWQNNLEQSIQEIRDLVMSGFSIIALDTEFPGIVCKPTGPFHSMMDYSYRLIKSNVDLLNLIQLGIALFSPDGVGHECIYQFNFYLDLENHLFASDSISFLRHSGIVFEDHFLKGIDIFHFGELLNSTGLVFNPNICWITFHGSYDFGYLLKLLIDDDLPERDSEFFALLNEFFPVYYDIKYLIRVLSGSLSYKSTSRSLLDDILEESLTTDYSRDHRSKDLILASIKVNSLSSIAEALNVSRFGIAHQAGSDAHVTGLVFLKFIRHLANIKKKDISNILFGLGTHRL